MPVYRAKHEVVVEADVNHTVIRERDTPYPNDRTAISAFKEEFGDGLLSIEDLEEEKIVWDTAPQEPETLEEAPKEPETTTQVLLLDEMSRDQLDEAAKDLGIDPDVLTTKADVRAAIEIARTLNQ